MNISAEREEAIRERFINNNSFPRLMGVVLDAIGDSRARLSVEVTERLKQPQGVMHGGAIATLIDTAVALAIVGTTETDERFTTVNMSVNYLSPVREGRVAAEARIVRKGRRIIVADCEVSDSDGKLIAKALVTYMLLS